MLDGDLYSPGNSQNHSFPYNDNTSQNNWEDWRWHLRHAIKNIETIEKLLDKQFSPIKKAQLDQTVARFPVSITPYYFSLIDRKNFECDPVFLQSVPDPAELSVSKHDLVDPLSEEKDSPVSAITHRYPDRVLFHVSNLCSMYCRHCTRKRKVGDVESIPSRKTLLNGIEYIKKTPVIRDVLLSGGDPFLLSDELLDWLLAQLRTIDHVEVIRIGTRTPVVLPQRITDDLVDIIAKYHPIWINTHFNHPREVTNRSAKALARLANAGIPLGNQSVLLAKVNDCPRIYKNLVHKLVRNRVRPYYLYQCDLSEGLSHFRTPVGKGIEIIENLIGHTSGFAVPTYVIDAPDGGGKIPVMPNYLISWSTNKVVLRNYEGMIATYKEPDSYQPFFCDRNCHDCHLTLSMDNECDESRAVGISRLLADYHNTTTLIPSNNARIRRRYNG